MPFTSSAPNFFGRLGAQTAPTNYGPAMDLFSKADATRSAMPNLFSTIQAVRANELERQTKQATIAKALQELAIQQQLAPVDQALKEAQTAQYQYNVNPNNPTLAAKTQATELKAKELELAQKMYDKMSGGGGQEPGGRGFSPSLSGMTGTKPRYDFDTEKEIADRATGLRKELTGLQEVKDYKTVKGQVKAMEALLKQGKQEGASRIAIDQGIITLFGKVTDPRSVVRESEYARTPEGQTLMNRFEGAYNKMLKTGGAGLTIGELEALTFGAKVIANELGDVYNQTIDQYETLASNFRTDKNLVSGGILRHKKFKTSESEKDSNITDEAQSILSQFPSGYTIEEVTNA